MVREEVATSAGDISGADSKVGGKPMRRKDGSGKGKGQPGGKGKNKPEDCRKKKIIKESDGFSFYQENDLNIFEITDQSAQEAYLNGYKRNVPEFWRHNEVTSEMMKHMNSERGRNFTVKIGDQHSFPLKQRR